VKEDLQRAYARRMRFAPTAAEHKLWGHLRKRSLNGLRFNRQVEITPYVVDFLCREHRLIVEVDGATHGEAHQIAYDQQRDEHLRSRGFRVHRVPNLEVRGAPPRLAAHGSVMATCSRRLGAWCLALRHLKDRNRFAQVRNLVLG
jgi:very-short-patch-repair endonuclease